MYTLTFFGKFTHTYPSLLGVLEDYKMAVAEGLAPRNMTITDPHGDRVDVEALLGGMARMLLPETEQTDAPWWATA